MRTGLQHVSSRWQLGAAAPQPATCTAAAAAAAAAAVPGLHAPTTERPASRLAHHRRSSPANTAALWLRALRLLAPSNTHGCCSAAAVDTGANAGASAAAEMVSCAAAAAAALASSHSTCGLAQATNSCMAPVSCTSAASAACCWCWCCGAARPLSRCVLVLVLVCRSSGAWQLLLDASTCGQHNMHGELARGR
jgi:hypothetical protein